VVGTCRVAGSIASLRDAGSQRKGCRRGARGDADLREDVGHVTLHGLIAEHERSRHFDVGTTLRDQAQNFGFSFGQSARQSSSPALRFGEWSIVGCAAGALLAGSIPPVARGCLPVHDRPQGQRVAGESGERAGGRVVPQAFRRFSGGNPPRSGGRLERRPNLLPTRLRPLRPMRFA
jgi:hypothetical protein